MALQETSWKLPQRNSVRLANIYRAHQLWQYWHPSYCHPDTDMRLTAFDQSSSCRLTRNHHGSTMPTPIKFAKEGGRQPCVKENFAKTRAVCYPHPRA